MESSSTGRLTLPCLGANGCDICATVKGICCWTTVQQGRFRNGILAFRAVAWGGGKLWRLPRVMPEPTSMTGRPPRWGDRGGVADIAKVWKIAARVQQTRISAWVRPSPGWFEQTSRTRRYRDLGSGLAGGIIRRGRAPSRAGQALHRQEAEKRPVDQGHGADANSWLTAKPEVVKVERAWRCND